MGLSSARFLRPILWFTVASIGTTTLHECAHAAVAFAMGVRLTLYSYYADLDMTPDQAAGSIPATVRVADPAACLVVGMLTWFALSRTRKPAVRLPLPVEFVKSNCIGDRFRREREAIAAHYNKTG